MRRLRESLVDKPKRLRVKIWKRCNGILGAMMKPWGSSIELSHLKDTTDCEVAEPGRVVRVVAAQVIDPA